MVETMVDKLGAHLVAYLVGLKAVHSVESWAATRVVRLVVLWAVLSVARRAAQKAACWAGLSAEKMVAQWVGNLAAYSGDAKVAQKVGKRAVNLVVYWVVY